MTFSDLQSTTFIHDFCFSKVQDHDSEEASMLKISMGSQLADLEQGFEDAHQVSRPSTARSLPALIQATLL